MLDAQMIERPADLRRTQPVNLAAGFRCMKIMAAPILIEAQRQAMSANCFGQRAEGRSRAFLRDQKSRIDRTCGIVQGHHQIEWRLPLQPGMARAVPGLRRGRL